MSYNFQNFLYKSDLKFHIFEYVSCGIRDALTPFLWYGTNISDDFFCLLIDDMDPD